MFPSGNRRQSSPPCTATLTRRNWVRGKFNVVKRFNVSSLRKGREIAAKGQTPEEKGLHFPEYACHGGGE